MNFPYSIEKSFTFNLPSEQPLILSDLLLQVQEKFASRDASDIRIENNTMQFKWRNSLLYFTYPVQLEFELTSALHIKYKFELMELIKILLVVVASIAFFARMQIQNLLIFIIISIVIIYLANVWYIVGQIKRSIISVPTLSEIADYDYMVRQNKQLDQQSQKNCMSCGKPLAINDCIWCGKKHNYYCNNSN